jgi:hypothetical protein
MFLTDQDEMSNLYRGPSIDASYQVSVHSAKATFNNQMPGCVDKRIKSYLEKQ